MQIAGHLLDVVVTPPIRDGAPTIVFLHEGLGTIALWRDFPERIARRTGFGTIVYSRYGNGFSDVLDAPRTPSYMHDEALVALPELLAACNVTKPVLFGHSDGASIALIYASAFPSDVSAVVALAPHVIVEDISVESIADIGRAYRTSSLREKMSRYHRDVDATFFGWNDVWLSPAFRSWSIVDRLASITAPVLALQGTGDEYGTLTQLELVAEHCRNVDRLILERCGHAPQRDRAALVEAVTAEWLLEASLSA